MAKDGLNLRHVKRLPAGIAAMFNGTLFVNKYTPPGAEKKNERDRFYNDLPYLLLTTQTDLMLAGDFNYVLPQSDNTGQKNFSTALDNIVYVFGLSDVWDASTRKIFTHCTPTEASRMDLIYISNNL